MRKTMQYEQVVCDMCDLDITEWGKSGIELKNSKWDLCENCRMRLETALTFLTTKVGLDIFYQWIKETQ